MSGSKDNLDGIVDLIWPFEILGQRMIRGWSPEHVEAALPGRRGFHSTKVSREAWKVLFELSRYARAGILPLYPYGRVGELDRIPATTVWLLYPRYPAKDSQSFGRGLVHFGNGEMSEAVADITRFREVVKADHSPLPPMGRPIAHPEFYALAKAFWEANPGRLKTGVVLGHIKMVEPEIYASVPESTRYRVVEKARKDARAIASNL